MALLMIATLLCIGSFLSVTPPADASATSESEKITRSVTIYRDTYGVPLVYGPTDASVVLASFTRRPRTIFSKSRTTTFVLWAGHPRYTVRKRWRMTF